VMPCFDCSSVARSASRALGVALSMIISAGCVRSGSEPAAATALVAQDAREDRGEQRPAAGPSAAAAPNRVSVTLEQDFGLIYGKDACGKEAQLSAGFACFRANGTQYHGTPLSDEGGSPSGAFPATMRLLIGFDRVLFESLTVGVRGGFVPHGGGPKPDGADAPEFLPFHGEARATYWFGAAPFAGQGFRWGIFFAAGIAQVDAAFRVRVEEDARKAPPAAQPSNPPAQTLDAYKKAGTGFVGGGAAVACAINRSSGLFVNLRFMQLFPSSGTVVAPEIGYEYGF
jgi:hypothetical protein